MTKVKRSFIPPRTRPREAHKSDIELDVDRELDDLLMFWERSSAEILYAAGVANLKELCAADDFFLQKELESLGVDWESREGYAAQIMRLTGFIREKEGAFKTFLVFCLGQITGRAGFHENWARGVVVKQNMAQATNRAHGPPEQRQKKRENLMQRFNALRREFSSDQAAYEAVAKEMNCKARTVRRAVTGY